MQSKNNNNEVFSEAEIRYKLDSLDVKQWAKLGKHSEYLACGLGIEGSDLLNIVICKTLEGARKCPKNVDVTVFLIGAMKSTVNAYLKRRNIDPLQQVVKVGDEETIEDYYDLNPKLETPDEILQAKQMLNSVEELFANDDLSLMIIMAQMDEMSPQEIQDCVGITSTQYDSAIKSIRRKYNKISKEL